MRGASNPPNLNSNALFEEKLLSKLKSSHFNFHTDNYDFFFRGRPPGNNKIKAAQKLIAFLSYSFLANRFRDIVANLSKFSYFYNLLEDDVSRELLISLLAYRALGFRKVKLARNNPEYWAGIDYANSLNIGLPPLKIPHVTWPLHCFDVKNAGFDMRVHTYAQSIAINFIQKQYVLKRKNIEVKVKPGDIVIDAGGCWGDTSLQFACETGQLGHVYVFEFAPSNLKVMRHNLSLNPTLSKLITILENPVGAVSGEIMYFLENGPASKIANEKIDDRYVECSTLSIDDLVAINGLKKVDFIKMDIEGSELEALIGAIKTLKKFRPKLAICIYHKPDDYLDIPKFLNELELGYKFYIEHHTIFLGETVLFAMPITKA